MGPFVPDIITDQMNLIVGFLLGIGFGFVLEQAVAAVALRFPLGAVPRPPYWSGYRVTPEVIEFWHQRPFRHHDRQRFTREGEGWRHEWLFP